MSGNIIQNCVIIPYEKSDNINWDIRFAREWCEEILGIRGLIHPGYGILHDVNRKWAAQYLIDGVDFWFRAEEDKMLFWLLWG